MTRRLVIGTLAVVLVCLLVLGVPLAWLGRAQVWSSARERLKAQAATVAMGVEDRLDAHEKVDPGQLAAVFPGRRIILRPTAGPTLSGGAPIRGEILQATVDVAGYAIVVQASADPAISRAREVTLVVFLLGLGAGLAAAALAVSQVRRIGEPITLLVRRADALGRAEFFSEPLQTGVAEVDRVSHVLERSARQIGSLVELQRNFASDAAHQIRSPLTSIGLHLDELGQHGEPEVRATADEALSQVERLNAVVSSLLERATGDSAPPELIDLAILARAEVGPWERLLSESGRSLVLTADPGAVVLARPAHISGILAALLENAVAHGRGAVRLAVTETRTACRVSVRDEGPGVRPDLRDRLFERRVSGNQGTGIGLALARSLAAAEDSRLCLSADDPAEFVLTIPRR